MLETGYWDIGILGYLSGQTSQKFGTFGNLICKNEWKQRIPSKVFFLKLRQLRMSFGTCPTFPDYFTFVYIFDAYFDVLASSKRCKTNLRTELSPC